MKLGHAAAGAHLTYCTNIHRGETWGETRAALEQHLPLVKRKVAPDEPMGVGLRLSALASQQLGLGRELDLFKDWLRSENLYVFTINGFPYGPFHGTRVKEDVYQPDWRTPERLAYTNRLADQLARLLPQDERLTGSISTVPATFRPIGSEPGALAAIVDNLLRHVAHLIRLRRESGLTVVLALEPEPMCYLETTGEFVAFFEQRLASRASLARLADLADLPLDRAETELRRHLGICYDVCHAAVEFEDPIAEIGRLRRAGVGIHKVQLSSALRVPSVGLDTRAELARFDEGVYLHQVVERRADGSLVRHLDLEPAFAALDQAQGAEWRVHCHVPVFVDRAGKLATTQDHLRTILALHRREPITEHLEVETYTFDILPDELRRVDVATAVARELEWVRRELAA